MLLTISESTIEIILSSVVVFIAGVVLLFWYKASGVKIIMHNFRKKYAGFDRIIEKKNKFYALKDGIEYELVFFFPTTNYELILNSFLIWDVRKNGSTRLIHMEDKLSSSTRKIVLVYGTSIKIKRYINENEMEFLEPDKLLEGQTYVMKQEEFDSFIGFIPPLDENGNT